MAAYSWYLYFGCDNLLPVKYSPSRMIGIFKRSCDETWYFTTCVMCMLKFKLCAKYLIFKDRSILHKWTRRDWSCKLHEQMKDEGMLCIPKYNVLERKKLHNDVQCSVHMQYLPTITQWHNENGMGKWQNKENKAYCRSIHIISAWGVEQLVAKSPWNDLLIAAH